MPTFFLHHVYDGVRLRDYDGHKLPDLRAARREAVLAIRAIQGNRLLSGQPLQNGHVEITDTSERVISQISYLEAVQPMPNDS